MSEKNEVFNNLLKDYFGELEKISNKYGQFGNESDLLFFSNTFKPSIESYKKLPRGELKEKFSTYQSYYLIKTLDFANQFGHLETAQETLKLMQDFRPHPKYIHPYKEIESVLNLKRIVLQKESFSEKEFYEEMQIMKAQLHTIPMIHKKDFLDSKYLLISFCYFNMNQKEDSQYWLDKAIEQKSDMILPILKSEFDLYKNNELFRSFIDDVENRLSPKIKNSMKVRI